MKYYVITCLLLLPCFAMAQKANPFESIGKKTEVKTLSNGRYQETFDDDVLQRVGSVVIDRRTKKIVQLLNADSIGNEASDNSTASRWYSVDPLAEKYYSMSPYSFCGNNPILIVDPDGRKLRLFGDELDLDGFKTAINVASQGQITVSIDKNGFTTLGIADGQTLSERNQAFYNTMNTVIADDQSTIIMVQGEAGDNRGTAYLGGYQNVSIPGLDYNVGTLDYVDMQETETGTNGQLSVLGFVTHETWENYDKQILNPNATFEDSHDAATQKQEKVDGVTNLKLIGNLEPNSDGKTVGGDVKIKFNNNQGVKQEYDVEVPKGNPTKILPRQ